MFEVTGINFNISAIGKNPNNFRIKKKEKLDSIIKFINSKNLDPTTKDKLIKIACKCPGGALAQFRKNFNKHLVAIKNEKDSKRLHKD